LITPGAGYHLGMLALSDPSQRDEAAARTRGTGSATIAVSSVSASASSCARTIFADISLTRQG